MAQTVFAKDCLRQNSRLPADSDVHTALSTLSRSQMTLTQNQFSEKSVVYETITQYQQHFQTKITNDNNLLGSLVVGTKIQKYSDNEIMIRCS